MKEILIYARVSSNDGTQDYNRQIDELKAIAIQNGYRENQIKVFAENISGFKKKEDRPQLSAMLELIETNPTTYTVYTSEISRIGRDPSETRQIIDKLTDIHVPVYIQSLNLWTIENGKRNSTTNIILQVLMEYAKVEADTLKVRSKSGMLKSAKSGKMGGGKSWAYGYTKDEKGMMIIDEEEAEVVKMIFEMYKQGNGYRVISNHLIAEGYPTRFAKSFGNKIIKGGKVAKNIKWSDNGIQTILTNTIYYGERKYKGEIISAPAIITKELFDECNNLRENKDFRNYTSFYTYLLKDICKCGKCGRGYFAVYKNTHHGDKVYACGSRLTKEGRCGNRSINISLIESAIYNELVNTDSILKYINNNKEIKVQLESDIKICQNKLTSINLNLEKKNKRLNSLLELRLDGDLSSVDYRTMSNEIKTEIETFKASVKLIEKEIREKSKALVNINSTKATKSMLIKAKENRTELQAIFKQIISRVIINQLDEKNVLVNLFIKLNGIELKNTLKIVLDLSGMKKKPAVNRYISFSKMTNDPVYDSNNVLLVDINDINEEVLNMLKYQEWIGIPDNSLLKVTNNLKG